MTATALAPVIPHLAHAIALAGLTLGLLALARWMHGRSTPLGPRFQLIDRANPAYGLLLGGFLAGTAIALAGTLFGRQTEPLEQALPVMACEGLLVIALMRIGGLVNDRLVLVGFSLHTEIAEDQNLAASSCATGSAIATGLVLNGALTGHSPDLPTGLRDTVILWAVGQVVLVVGAQVYRRLGRFDIHRLIQFDDNTAAGVRFGSFLAGLGIVVRGSLLRAPLADATHVWQTIALSTGGLMIFAALCPLARRLALGMGTHDEEIDLRGNLAMAFADAAITLGWALLVATAIERTLTEVVTDAV